MTISTDIKKQIRRDTSFITTINTNIPALNARRSNIQATRSFDQSLSRLSLGSRINSGADNAAGIAVYSKKHPFNATSK